MKSIDELVNIEPQAYKGFAFTVNTNMALDKLASYQFEKKDIYSREFIQNSLDADSDKIEVYSNEHFFMVKDNGSGMSKYDIDEFLLKVFKSNKRDERPKDKIGKFKIGEFGIGLISALGIRPNEINIQTYKKADSENQPYELVINNKLNLNVYKTEKKVPGTSIVVFKTDKEKLVNYYFEEKFDYFNHAVKNADEEIILYALRSPSCLTTNEEYRNEIINSMKKRLAEVKITSMNPEDVANLEKIYEETKRTHQLIINDKIDYTELLTDDVFDSLAYDNAPEEKVIYEYCRFIETPLFVNKRQINEDLNIKDALYDYIFEEDGAKGIVGLIDDEYNNKHISFLKRFIKLMDSYSMRGYSPDLVAEGIVNYDKFETVISRNSVIDDENLKKAKEVLNKNIIKMYSKLFKNFISTDKPNLPNARKIEKRLHTVIKDAIYEGIEIPYMRDARIFNTNFGNTYSLNELIEKGEKGDIFYIRKGEENIMSNVEAVYFKSEYEEQALESKYKFFKDIKKNEKKETKMRIIDSEWGRILAYRVNEEDMPKVNIESGSKLADMLNRRIQEYGILTKLPYECESLTYDSNENCRRILSYKFEFKKTNDGEIRSVRPMLVLYNPVIKKIIRCDYEPNGNVSLILPIICDSYSKQFNLNKEKKMEIQRLLFNYNGKNKDNNNSFLDRLKNIFRR